MNTSHFLGILRIILVFSILVIFIGCGGGAGGGNKEGTAETALTAAIDSPSGIVSINKGESVEFKSTVSGGNTPYTYKWDFNGGATNSAVEDPGSVVFSIVGSYTVNLLVTDNKGATASASVSVSVKDTSGTDITPPTVSSSTPSNGATGVAINSTLSVTLTESIDTSTITTSTFTLSSGGSPVSGTVNCSGSTATFTPMSPLSKRTSYTAKITTGVKDLSGNALASEYTWSFTTIGAFGGGSSEKLPLSVTITSPSESINIYLDDSINFLATVSGGSKPYNYKWVSNGGTYLPIYFADYSDKWSCYWDLDVDDNSFISTKEAPGYLGFIKQGSYTASLTVTDDNGGKATDELRINVNSEYNPEAPNVTITVPTPNQTFKVGDSIVLEYSISGGTSPYVHTLGAGCTYSYDFTDGSIDVPDCYLPTIVDDTVVFTHAGNYSCILTVLDSAGRSSNGGVSVIVEE